MSRKAIAIATGVVIVILFALWRLTASAPPPVTVDVEKDAADAADRVVTASALIVPLRQAKLGFKIPGRVREVRVKAGDVVKAGDILVKLDDGDLQQQVATALAGLELAQALLAQVLAGSRPEEIAAAQANYEGATARYEQAVGPAAAADTQTAEANLAAARERLAQVQAAAKTDVRAAEANLAAAQATLDQLLAGPRAEDLRAAELQLEQAKNTLWATQIERDGAKGNPLNAEYLGYAGDAKVAAAETAVTIATTALGKLKAGATAGELASARAAVEQASAQLEIKRSTRDAGVSAAEAAVASAGARLKQLRDGPTNPERQQLASSVGAAKAQLALRQAGAAQADVDAAQARLKQAEAALAGALIAAGEGTLLAPFDGTVAEVSVNEGQILPPSEVIVTFGDLRTFQIETTDLRETSIARVRVGQSVSITLDALPGRTLHGTVVSIAPLASAAVGGTNFAVKIELAEQEPNLRWGMTAIAEIAANPLPSAQ